MRLLRTTLQRLLALRPFGIGESESIMQFSRLGSLTCLCDGRHATSSNADRRQVCRDCGGLPEGCDRELLDRTTSAGEERALVQSLRLAGVRARGQEIPEHIRTLAELHAYLDAQHGKRGRKPPRRPNAPVALVRTLAR